MKSNFRAIIGRSKMAVGFLAVCTLLALSPAVTLADRGGGSIRAENRPAPPPPRAEPPHGEPPHAEPPHNAPPPENHPEPPHGGPDDHHDVHTQPPPHVDEQGHRDWDDNDEDAQRWGGYGHGTPVRIIRGQRIHDLPQRHFGFIYNNVNYFYDPDGLFYQPQPDGEYVVVQPPVGAVIAALPDSVVPIQVGPTTYDYLDGVFYIAQDDSFAVVNPPPGIVVPYLPSDATTVVINGNVSYQFDGFNYQPSIQDGVTVYTVTPM